MGVEVKVEATTSDASTRGPSAAPSTRYNGVGVVGAVASVRHYVVRFVHMLKRFGLVTSWDCSAICFLMVIVVMSVYIFLVGVCGTVSTLHRSRVGWWRGVVGIQRGIFVAVFQYVGWGRSIFC